MEKAENSIPISKIINTIIGLGIIFFGRYLPAPSMIVETTERLTGMGFPQVDGGTLVAISPVGMVTLTIFIGVIYLWGTVDTLWPSFLGVFALGISQYAPMPKVLSQFMGNPMVVMMFFLLIFIMALVKTNIAAWLAKWVLSRKFIQGKPWVFTATVLFSTYFLAFLDQTSSCFIVWAALAAVFNEVGLKKGDKYVSVMVTSVTIMALLAFASDAIKGGAFFLVMNLMTMATSNPALNATALPIGSYMLFAIIISLISISCLLLMMRFVYRIDMTPLKNVGMAESNETLPPMTRNQKYILGIFLLYVLWLILPSIIGPKTPMGQFMVQNAMGGSIVTVLLMSIIKVDGQPLGDITKVNIPWTVFFLVAVAMLLGGAMTDKITNFTIFTELFLRNLLTGLDVTMLAVVVILIGIFFTNFCNSVVFGLILTPVLLAICAAFGFLSAPIMACFIFIVLIAACTPAASPFAALLIGYKEWITPGDASKYALAASIVITLVVICVGIPLSRLIFS